MACTTDRAYHTSHSIREQEKLTVLLLWRSRTKRVMVRETCVPLKQQRVLKELTLEVRILGFTLFPTWWTNLSEDWIHLCNDRTVLDTSERLPVIWHESTALRDFVSMSVDACLLVKSFELESQGTNSLSLQFFYVNDLFIQYA